MKEFITVLEAEGVSHVMIQEINSKTYNDINTVAPAEDYEAKLEKMVSWFDHLKQNYLTLIYSSNHAKLYKLNHSHLR
jgi:hypothetical protein